MGSNAGSTPEQGLEAFRKTVSVYEHRVGHICRHVASQIPPLIKDFPSDGGSLLDNACGTGAATEEWLKVYPKTQVSAQDITPAMVNAFKAVINDSPFLRVQVKDIRIEDSQQLSYADNTFDATVMNFAIFFLPDPVQGIKEIYRTLKPGGTTAVSTWKTFGFRPIWEKVQDYVKPANRLIELPVMEPWCHTAKLAGVMKEAGFIETRFHIAEAALWGTDPEDFKLVLVESFGAFVSRTWSDEEKAQLGPATSKVVDEFLAEGSRVCVRDGMRVGCVGDAWVAVATK